MHSAVALSWLGYWWPYRCLYNHTIKHNGSQVLKKYLFILQWNTTFNFATGNPQLRCIKCNVKNTDMQFLIRNNTLYWFTELYLYVEDILQRSNKGHILSAGKIRPCYKFNTNTAKSIAFSNHLRATCGWDENPRTYSGFSDDELEGSIKYCGKSFLEPLSGEWLQVLRIFLGVITNFKRDSFVVYGWVTKARWYSIRRPWILKKIVYLNKTKAVLKL